MREGGVAVAQGFERQGRVGDDLPAVRGHDALLLGDAVGEEAWEVGLLLAFLAQSQLHAGGESSVLFAIGAVIDAYAKARFDQVFVGDFGPTAAPLKELAGGVPAAVLLAET